MPRWKKLEPSEHDIQVSVFDWARTQQEAIPELKLMFSTHNGARVSFGTARKLKAEGMKSGVPDICLPVPRNGYSALWLELKRPKQYPSPEQRAWHEMLRTYGNKVEVTRSLEETATEILRYLGRQV